MEKNEAIAKARQDLEKLYSGIPDDSVDLTFRYLAKTEQQHEITSSERKVEGNEPMKNSEKSESPSTDPWTSAPANKGQAQRSAEIQIERLGMASSPSNGREERELHGIPHSNTCALCSSHVHIFRHRCLVCGRVYCKNCVEMGMGKMTEGRKCIECLGRRFSQRYIKRAGKSGCCFGYPSEVKQQELIWAEKGPIKSCDGKHNSSLVSCSRNPAILEAQSRPQAGNTRNFIVTRSPGFSSSPNGFTLQGK
ncbi:hypothetical protein IEQ34_004985 [Dendrobium chrysotoxum]|uniref:FYVE-type domain-containing protein n=1 Tax=Dendrobium chrysotoxum TaxID=161865 RepID=A0AAV7HAI9_DENCH|nr:hypothetical protein IEQ34_004985 [Dendrobium chrysotoxum]